MRLRRAATVPDMPDPTPPPRHGPTSIEVRATIAPDGTRRVLLQLEDGYVLLLPVDAAELARILHVVAEEIESG